MTMEGSSTEPRGPAPEEQTLLAALRAGDEQAYESLVRTYGARLLSTARRMVGNEEDARDVVQEAYISAFKALDSFNGWVKAGATDTAIQTLQLLVRRIALAKSGAGMPVEAFSGERELLLAIAQLASLEHWAGMWEKLRALGGRIDAINLDIRQSLLMALCAVRGEETALRVL